MHALRLRRRCEVDRADQGRRRWKACCCSIRSTNAACRSSAATMSRWMPVPALVHTAPAHGLDDYVVGSRYKLPVDSPVGDDGKFYRQHAAGRRPVACGRPTRRGARNPARPAACCCTDEKLQHSYPHCWRHKTPIIFRATPQWFIGMESACTEAESGRQPLRDSAATDRRSTNTEFFPSWGRARLEAMIKNRPDWCVSRQRNWGVPMPFFVHKETGELHPRTAELLEQVAQRVEQQGIEAWFSLDAAELLGADAAHYKKAERHPGRVVRFRHHPCLRAEAARRSGASRRPVSGRLRPASRLVPVVAAHRLRHRRPRALQGAAHPRLRGGRQRPQDEQVQGQRDRAAESDGHAAAPTSCACGWPPPIIPAS